MGIAKSAVSFLLIINNPFLGFEVSKHYYVFSTFLTVPKNEVKEGCWHYWNRGAPKHG